VAYLSQYKDQLDEDSLRRLETNPLRILDSKNPEVQAIVEGAPKLNECLDEESLQHFQGLCERLSAMGIQYQINPKLVRGLDYYNRTVFEWVTKDLGAQGTVCAGGRYDGLVAQLGGKATPAVGFAMGLERLALLLEQTGKATLPEAVDVYVSALGEQAELAAFKLAEHLRNTLPELRVQSHCGGGNFKKQMKRADKSGAQIALLIGESEVEQNTVTLKPLRFDAPQQTVAQADIASEISTMLAAFANGAAQ